MAYSGWYINSDGAEVYNTYKTTDEYLSAITYVDEDGVPQDWLFDDVVVMGHYYTSGGKFVSYKAGYKSGEYYATQEDWYEWLCYAFGMDTEGNSLSYDGNDTINLNALEEAAAIAKEALNDPDYKVGVKLVVYPAVEFQENWGTLNGETIDFTIDGAGSKEKALENRTAAYQWYIDTALQMWEDAGFENLELTGFYYYEETIHESTDRIAEAATQALTSIVHSASTPSTNTTAAFDDRQGGRLYIFQLPYYQSEGYYKWADYGFDYALMQPNYAFYDTYTVTQLYECGELCQYYGLGMQMEFGGAGNRGYTMKFEDYLELGQEIGYQDSVLSWYMSTYGCYQISQNEYDLRYLYDAIYQFVKGEAISFDEEETEMDPTVSTYNLALGVEAEFSYGEILGIVQYWTVSEIEGAVGLLTDGINDSANFWVNDITNYYIGINPSLISGPYTFTFDLGDTYRLSSLHSYFGDRQGWGYYAPANVTYEVSVDGETWVTAGTVSADEAEVNSVYDERNPDSIPDIYDFGLDVDYDGYRYVRITFEANGTGTIFFGEMEVYGTVCMDTEETYDLAGNLIPSFEYVENLQDMLYWSVSEINAALEILSDDITNSPNYWVNATSNYYIGINKTYISGPYGFIYDLGYHYRVTKLESYFYDRPAWGVAAPESVDYYGSTDGETWVLLGSVSKSDAIVETVEDTRNPDDTPPDIYNFALEGDFSGYSYVKAVFSAADSVNVVACGEFDVYGTSDRVSSTSGDSTDTTQLEKLIDAAGEIDGASYTTDSYQALVEALAAAQAVLADENASQDEIDAAAAALEAALGALTLVDTGTENDDGSDDDSDDGSDNEDENTGSDGTAATDTDASDPGTTGSETTVADSSADGVKSPATGDESSIWLFVFGLIAAAAAGGLILIEAMRKSGRNSG
ncbi:MAG: DUF4855 domain-containing protein [Lachnospiraceae bacterium]|nr:DUF4855 domain-containing protein [Lachnospiraceae bacterium]